MFEEVLLLIKHLDTTPSGTIKTSIANLKRVQAIRTRLSKIANNKDYLRAVTTNARFADLQEELRTHLLGKDGGQGAFAQMKSAKKTHHIWNVQMNT